MAEQKTTSIPTVKVGVGVSYNTKERMEKAARKGRYAGGVSGFLRKAIENELKRNETEWNLDEWLYGKDRKKEA